MDIRFPRHRQAALVGTVAGLLVFACLVAPAGATKYAGAFMVDGGGARALGMGSAFVAVADDASATFWNPAGLAGQPGRELLIMHSERFGDLVDRDFASYVHALGGDAQQTLGLTVIRLGIDDIPFTSHLQAQLDGSDGTTPDGTISDSELANIFLYRDEIRYESDSELALMATYARRAGDWQIGGNLKLIRQSVGDFSSFGIGIDLGLLRRDWYKRLDVGVKLQDATSTYLSWDTGENETIAPVVITGAAYDWSFDQLRLDLTLSGALESHFDNRGTVDEADGGVDQFPGLWDAMSTNLFLGVEARLSDKVDLRVGSHGGFDSEDWTFGAGLDLTRFRVDYAFAGDVLGFDDNSHFTHRISLGVDF